MALEVAGPVLIYGSLFTGIGMIDHGLERAGMRCAWQVERNPFRRLVLHKHWPKVRRYSDIEGVDFETIERVDGICAGFPCQPVSTAGLRLAQADPRWLWPHVVRAIRGIRPRFVLLENVPGLLVRGMGDVLGDLAACGYDAEWQVLSAAAFSAPNLRERIFVVAYPNSRRQIESCTKSPVESIVFSRNEFDRSRKESRWREWWASEPNVGRMANGNSYGLDRHRLDALGDSVVPQIVEWIGLQIVDWSEKEYT